MICNFIYRKISYNHWSYKEQLGSLIRQQINQRFFAQFSAESTLSQSTTLNEEPQNLDTTDNDLNKTGPRINQQESPQSNDYQTIQKSALHYEIENFVKLAKLSEAESVRRLQVIEQIRKCCAEVHPSASVLPFGSLATGTALKDSDVDLLICYLMQPDDYARGGFTEESRVQVISLLKQLTERMQEQLQNFQLVELVQKARFPLARIEMDNIKIEVSIQDDVGVQQCRYVRAIIDQKWQILPLVIVLKALVKTYQVHNVFSGGIGGYTIVNMVIAFIMMREMRELRVDDLGILLTTFLRYFGFVFDYDMRALSIRRGGLVSKSSVAVGQKTSYRRDREEMRLCTEDPITGRDISCGTRRMGEVRYAFGDAYRTIKYASQHVMKLREEAAIKDDKYQKDFPILSGFVQMDQFLSKKRRQGVFFSGEAEQIQEVDCDLQQGQIGQ
eukprot:TRINITY_DN2004_c0_g1_i1.p1 TRINITY_DN2004_c0_g1~~TRINITY_DN2004_c0_g1_i1.p1  ORF type:complete len:455 (+),score=48.54 TRINITY_DN2004_c0_g1_i1:36-1367(+)